MQSKWNLPVLTMIVLFSSAAMVEVFHLSSLSDLAGGNVWWHLSTGFWMMRSHGVPHTGLYSQSSGSPWIASSWGYELILAFSYRLFGLRAIPVLYIGFKALFAVVTFLLAGGLRGRFWPAVAWSAAAQYVLISYPSGPTGCSVVLFSVELLLLTASRRTGSVRPLYWLPPLFLLWANLHVQFVYGIAAMLAMLAISFLEDLGLHSGAQWFKRERPSASIKIIAAFVALSLIATLITPYFYHPYEVFFAITKSAANFYLADFQAMQFHHLQDYVLMLMTMGAFFSLGLRRSRDLFFIVLLAGCAMLSFHSQRDAWAVTVAAVAVLGEAFRGGGNPADEHARDRQLLTTVALTAGVLFLAVMLHIPRSRQALLARIGTSYPVVACNYIREQHLPQPLFNPYEWGGFVSWYLPEYPVAVDGRTDLYGDENMIQYSKVMKANIPISAYPAFNQAATILLQRNSLMGDALSDVSSFKVVYRDDVSVVLLPIRP